MRVREMLIPKQYRDLIFWFYVGLNVGSNTRNQNMQSKHTKTNVSEKYILNGHVLRTRVRAQCVAGVQLVIVRIIIYIRNKWTLGTKKSMFGTFGTNLAPTNKVLAPKISIWHRKVDFWHQKVVSWHQLIVFGTPNLICGTKESIWPYRI